MANFEPVKYIERYCAILANIVVILGIPLFFYQQYESKLSDAEKATLSYVQRFQDRDFIEARLALFDQWKYFPVRAGHADLDSARDFAKKDMLMREKHGDRSINAA